MHHFIAVLSSFVICFPAVAQEFQANPGQLNELYPGSAYSPYADRNYPEIPLWGDTHVHTSLSSDAGGFGNRIPPRGAYRLARGEQITASSGQPIRLSRPLDWLVITDHSDGLGIITDLLSGAPSVMRFEQGARWSREFRKGGQAAIEATQDMIEAYGQGKIDPELSAQYAPGARRYATIWEDVIAAAEEYNDPGQFTTLIGFEWTSLVNGGNMHRNVIFRDGADRVRQVLPFTTTPPAGSIDPLDLYKYLENYEKTTNGAVLATAHNGNLSNGIMFPVDAQYTGKPLDEFYVSERARWERMYEITQIKGDGEAHPMLSPEDEFADYGTWDHGNLDITELKTDDMLQYEYAREALKNGLLLEETLGTNPYKFALQGGTDTHTSLSTAQDDNFFGKHPGYEPAADRLDHIYLQTDKFTVYSWQQMAAGLTAVWASDNTREAVFDAMDRREVYATTGPRMSVRMFGGWSFTEADINSRQAAAIGYDKGVPMGGDLPPQTGHADAPNFMVYALRDPMGANLDRIQIVKGWLDTDGNTHEKVYDVAWSDSREPDENGIIPPVGNTVDVAAANWTNTIGASELGAVWIDPDFDPIERSFYYARVIEIPTPPWYVYDAFRYGTDLPQNAPISQQERAYTSPIWYSPAG